MTPIVRKITPNNINDIVDDLALLIYSQQPQVLADYKDIIYNYLIPEDIYSAILDSEDIYSAILDSEHSGGISSKEAIEIMKERISKAFSRTLDKGSV